MAADSRVVLYGNSVFLAGIKAQLEHDTLHPYPVTLNLIAIETGSPQVIDLIREQKPRAVLFDLALPQPHFVVSLLREQPDLLFIGVDPSSNEMLVLSSRPQLALSISDLVEAVNQK